MGSESIVSTIRPIINRLFGARETSFRSQKNTRKTNIILKSGRNLAMPRIIPGTLVRVVANIKIEYIIKYFLIT
jgi:hypothetical protein